MELVIKSIFSLAFIFIGTALLLLTRKKLVPIQNNTEDAELQKAIQFARRAISFIYLFMVLTIIMGAS